MHAVPRGPTGCGRSSTVRKPGAAGRATSTSSTRSLRTSPAVPSALWATPRRPPSNRDRAVPRGVRGRLHDPARELFPMKRRPCSPRYPANDGQRLSRQCHNRRQCDVEALRTPIRAAEKIGVRIPRFCDHPLLKPAGACRQCLVEVARPGRDGVVAKGPKPVPSCAEAVTPGMEVYTQRTSEVAAKAQRGIIEFLLINHPLDCPICDKGGECPSRTRRFRRPRRIALRRCQADLPQARPGDLGDPLDRDRCILCQRCTRFQSQIAGDPFIALQGAAAGPRASRFTPSTARRSGALTRGSSILRFRRRARRACPRDYVGSYGGYGLAEGFRRGPRWNPRKQTNRAAPSPLALLLRQRHSDLPGGRAHQLRLPLPLAALRPRVRPRRDRARRLGLGHPRRLPARRGPAPAGVEDPEVNEDWITDKDRFASG